MESLRTFLKLARKEGLKMVGKKTATTFVVLMVVLIFVWYATAAEASIVKNGLVSYWPFEEATIQKKVVEDLVGDNNATMEGEAETVEGKVGQALHFDANDRLEVMNNKSLDLVREWSIDTWVKGDKAPDNGGAVAQWFSKGNTYQLNWDHNNDTYKSVATQMTGGWLIIAQIKEKLEAETWYHIAGIWAGRSLKIYLNGKLSNTRNWSGSSALNELPLTIGGPGFSGAIDEVKLYDRALTDAEVLQNFEHKLGVASPTHKLPTLWGEIKRR